MVQRTGAQGQGNILFVQNNFYYDAFFLKAIGEYWLRTLLETWVLTANLSSERCLRKWDMSRG